MPLVKVANQNPGFTWYPPVPARHSLPPPTLGQATDAAFELEGPVRAAFDLFTRQHHFEPEDNFDPASWLKENNLWEERDNFIEVRSSAEAQAIAGRLRKRERAMRTLSAAGPVQGFVLATAAGILSPTSLLPLTAGGKGVRALMQGAAYGALAGGIDEGILGMAQEGRTTGEMVMGVAATTVLGAGLGGAGAALTRRAQRRMMYDLTRQADLVDTPGANLYMRGTDGSTRMVRPAKGTFRFARSVEIPDTLGPVRIREEPEGSVAGPTYEVDIDNGLIIDPDTLPLIRQGIKGDLTEENLIKFAEDEGFDAVTFEGFQDGAGDAAARYGGREQVPYEALTPEDQAQAASLVAGTDEAIPDTVNVRELEGVRGRELDIEDQVVVFDRSKIRSVPDDDPVMQLPRLGRGFEDVPNGLVEIAGIPAGAAVTQAKRGGKLAPGLGNWMAGISLSARVMQKRFRTGQWAAINIDPGGLHLNLDRRFTESSDGPPASAAIRTWYNGFYQATNAIDEAYNKYYFSGGAQPAFAKARATVGGMMGSRPKISKSQFREEIGRAMRMEDKHEIAEVGEAAGAVRRLVYEPLGEELKRMNLIPEEVDLKGDTTYLNRVYNRAMIRARQEEFIVKLQTYYHSTIMERFQTAIRNLRGAEERTGQLVQDVSLSTEDLQRVRADIELEIHDLRKDPLLLEPEEMETTPSAHQLVTEFGEPIGAAIEGSVGSLRQSLRDLFNLLKKPEVDPKQAAKKLDEVRKAERRAKAAQERTGEQIPDLAQVYRLQGRVDEAARLREIEAMEPEAREAARQRGREKLKGLRKRMSSLNKHRAVFEARQAAKVRKIERAEELNLKGLRTLIKKGRRALDEIDNLSDEARAKRVSELRTTFAQVAEQFDRAEERIARAADPEVPAAQLQRADKLTRIAEELENADTLSAADLRALIREGLEEAITKTNDANSRRALRQQKLREQAETLTPERAAEVRTRAEERLTQRRLGVRERFRALGAEDVDTDAATMDFTSTARKRAEETVDKILNGSPFRLPGIDIIRDQRGPELARVLGIPSSEIDDFLENDIELLMRAYLRTVAPDVEIAKKFGTPSGSLMFDDLKAERDALRAQVAARTDVGVDQKNAMLEDINSEYDGVFRDLNVMLERMRHTWAVPEDPHSWGTRAARMVMNLNVGRYMGGVSIASIPDPAYIMMRQGFTRTLRDGFVPLVTNFKQFRLSAREAKFAGDALDPVLHTRMAALTDVMDDIRPGSKLERGTEWLTRRMGIIGLFDYWTSGWKQFTAGIVNLRMMDSIDLAINGNGTAKEVSDALQFLGEVGIDERLARAIWAEMQRGGAQRIKGVWVPETEKWTDAEAKQAFRSALTYEISNSVVTPGVDAPIITNKNIGFKILFQFKSFMIAATSKVLMAGLQKNDAGVYVGFAASIAMGMLSYYLWASATGGRAYQEMLDAPLEKWVDEGIDRSGVGGALVLGREFAQNVPGMSQASQAFPPLGILSSFSGERTTRRGGHSLTEAALGPSFDFLTTMSQVVSQIDDPTQSTLHAARKMTPLQNVFYLRQLLDFVEDAVGEGLPETRDARSRRQATPAPARP